MLDATDRDDFLDLAQVAWHLSCVSDHNYIAVFVLQLEPKDMGTCVGYDGIFYDISRNMQLIPRRLFCLCDGHERTCARNKCLYHRSKRKDCKDCGDNGTLFHGC